MGEAVGVPAARRAKAAADVGAAAAVAARPVPVELNAAAVLAVSGADGAVGFGAEAALGKAMADRPAYQKDNAR